jgi:RNA polymerase sigma-70 factor (ECF subfamily)
MTADLAARFDGQREQMFGIAYRMLGSRAEAEDLLQEAWLRFSAAAASGSRIDSDRAYLSTVVTRLSLDRLKSAAARRESYVGPWLPEPIRAEPDDAPPADDRLGRAESVTIALLLALEALSPLERAVLILREVIELGFDEVAEILETSPAACRQLLHRARAHVRSRRPRYPSSRAQHARLATAFFTAAQGGDPAPLMSLLAEDAVAISDGGGRVPSARNPIRGREAVARYIAGQSRKAGAGLTTEVAWLNGCLGVILRDGPRAIYAAIAETDGEQVVAVRLIANPDKLQGLDRPLA